MLEDLSDGEYQLLFLFALIDIFDSEDTLFLLDEADSHLHFRNIDLLWKEFSSIEGRILTTTHLIDSIAKSGMDRLKVIENGAITNGNVDKLVARLKDLSEINQTLFLALSMFKNIVLVDAENDWEIFKFLIKRKLSKTKNEDEIELSFKNFVVVPCSSGYGKHTEDFGKKKKLWVENFANFLNGRPHNTRDVFLICDRDELPLGSIGTEKCKLLLQGDSCKKFNQMLTQHLLSWRRREIKHYLLSYTALEDDIENISQELDLGKKSELRPKSSGDETTDQKINAKLANLDSEIVKKIVGRYIDGERGFCIDKTRNYVNKILPEEISDDIVDMYNYLVGIDDQNSK